MQRHVLDAEQVLAVGEAGWDGEADLGFACDLDFSVSCWSFLSTAFSTGLDLNSVRSRVGLTFRRPGVLTARDGHGVLVDLEPHGARAVPVGNIGPRGRLCHVGRQGALVVDARGHDPGDGAAGLEVLRHGAFVARGELVAPYGVRRHVGDGPIVLPVGRLAR